MVNYTNSYIEFIEAKKLDRSRISGTARAKNHLQLHHILPKSCGGGNGDNLALLKEFDHCIAHILLAVAAIQNGEAPINYCLPRSFVADIHNMAQRWKPVSELRFYGERASDGSITADMTLLETACFLAKQHKCILKNRGAKNQYMMLVLSVAISPTKNYCYGYNWKVSF